MNATDTISADIEAMAQAKAAERRAKDAQRARERRAAAKAAKAAEAPAVEAKREIVLDDQTYTVSASLSDDEAAKVAHLLHTAYLDRKNGTPDGAVEPAVVKPPKPVKLKGDVHATVFYRLSRTAMEALESNLGAEYRKANPASWKVLKGSKKIAGGQSWAFTGNLRPADAVMLANALRAIAGTEGFAKPGSLLTNAMKLESNHYTAKAADKR